MIQALRILLYYANSITRSPVRLPRYKPQDEKKSITSSRTSISDVAKNLHNGQYILLLKETTYRDSHTIFSIFFQFVSAHYKSK